MPHRLVVRLAADDLTALRAATPGLAASLADAALAFARAHAYTLLERPSVTLRADPSVEARRHRGRRAGGIAASRPSAAAASGWAGREPAMRSGGRDRRGPVRRRRPPRPSDPPAIVRRDATAVFVVPTAEGPRATIREIRPDRSSRTFAFEGRPLTIGRSSDNGLVLRDGRASRHHARIDVPARLARPDRTSAARTARGSTTAGSSRSPSARATRSASG